jgi:hypothetical protein
VTHADTAAVIRSACCRWTRDDWVSIPPSPRIPFRPRCCPSPQGRCRVLPVRGHGYASTVRPPTIPELKLAKRILAGTDLDLTRGAIQFDSPRAQRALLKAGKKGYRKTPEDVAAARQAAGMQMVTVPGVPAETTRFWRPIKRRRVKLLS